MTFSLCKDILTDSPHPYKRAYIRDILHHRSSLLPSFLPSFLPSVYSTASPTPIEPLHSVPHLLAPTPLSDSDTHSSVYVPLYSGRVLILSFIAHGSILWIWLEGLDVSHYLKLPLISNFTGALTQIFLNLEVYGQQVVQCYCRINGLVYDIIWCSPLHCFFGSVYVVGL